MWYNSHSERTGVFTVNWIGLVRSLQAEIVGSVGALLLILVIWLVVRLVIGRSATGGAQARLRAWTNRGASVLALLIVGGMLWHVITVAAVNRLPRQDADGSPVSERRDAVTKKESRERITTMGFHFFGPFLLAALGGLALAACDQSYQNISPNYIGMKLTPTGYEDTIYTPGQVDIGTTSQAGQGNQLVLIQRSGVEIKEQFLGKEGNKDGADHRCLTQEQNPMTLDVSGHIRKICSQYPDFSSAFKSFGAEKENLTDRIAASVGTVLVEQGVPLRLVGVQVSNMKPDDSVVEAQVAQKAAEARTAAIKTLTDFLDQDPTGTRKMVYRMQVLQELTRTANANGHNTIFLTDLGGSGAGVLPLPSGR